MNGTFSSRNLSALILGYPILGVIATIVSVTLYVEKFGYIRSGQHETWAQFGDFLGGTLGIVFAFLALLALLTTIHLQHQELTNSSKALRNSADALSEQSESIKLQNFENRFFNMLTLHHTIVGEMDLRRSGTVRVRGRDCLKTFYKRLIGKFSFDPQLDDSLYLEALLRGYGEFYRNNGHELSHYFRNIYRIIKYVENSDVNNKADYSGILRAQLSNHELGLLFYNGLSQHGEKLKPLAERYALFENMETELLYNVRRDVRLYRSMAFGDRAESLFE